MHNNGIIAHSKDNVCTIVQELKAKDTIMIKDANREENFHVIQDIPCFHKVALVDIAKGKEVFKYGEVIGVASGDIKKGEHVHVHNVESTRGRGDRK
ncbi:UxaA family hydrolase [Alkaliphilus hydrothermalis]|uniref:Altronate dehydratase small subunit n=1 Tax=Alkaliphilus hydrothermalis TaxID=1482730 RepID=A0ABS2NRP9_9FIRM|nr:UxaA family hydrolase [Alkaliphilus hydrothermalis]MBM7615623.1 altronate dehydratase small subunit [Alkaliphilus hydrothermalis]